MLCASAMAITTLLVLSSARILAAVSYMFEYSLVAGLTASGADAYLLHVTTTPSVAYIARVDDFDCGIMISASHNPYYDNGVYYA